MSGDINPEDKELRFLDWQEEQAGAEVDEVLLSMIFRYSGEEHPPLRDLQPVVRLTIGQAATDYERVVASPIMKQKPSAVFMVAWICGFLCARNTDREILVEK